PVNTCAEPVEVQIALSSFLVSKDGWQELPTPSIKKSRTIAGFSDDYANELLGMFFFEIFHSLN
ncbi:MAG TPA: hypothetical protein PLA77_11850, partial [Bacteroidales bacterium]|nr:hypothetical protein [Bacteroidales bacterium]